MRLVDFLESPDEGKKQFTSDEIANCAESGECCQCGLCCIVFDVRVPLKNPKGSLFYADRIWSPALKPCHHLEETREGVFRCLLQEEKWHPILADCVEWSGNNSSEQHGTEHARLVPILAARLLDDPSSQRIATIEKFISRGMIHSRLPILEEYETRYMEFFRMCVHTCPTLPVRLLHNIGTAEWLAKIDVDERIRILEDIGVLPPNSEKGSQFLELYAPDMLTLDYGYPERRSA